MCSQDQDCRVSCCCRRCRRCCLVLVSTCGERHTYTQSQRDRQTRARAPCERLQATASDRKQSLPKGPRIAPHARGRRGRRRRGIADTHDDFFGFVSAVDGGVAVGRWFDDDGVRRGFCGGRLRRRSRRRRTRRCGRRRRRGVDHCDNAAGSVFDNVPDLFGAEAARHDLVRGLDLEDPTPIGRQGRVGRRRHHAEDGAQTALEQVRDALCRTRDDARGRRQRSC